MVRYTIDCSQLRRNIKYILYYFCNSNLHKRRMKLSSDGIYQKWTDYHWFIRHNEEKVVSALFIFIFVPAKKSNED